MGLIELLVLAIGLSMDACALTIANCSTYKDCIDRKKEWAMPVAFATFQGLMPLIGFFIGSAFSNTIGTIADYLTAGIFFFLSGKIVFDIIKDSKEEKCCPINDHCEKTALKFTFSALIIQAVATSIDALAVGVTLINLTFSVYIAVLVIAVVTFLLVSAALIFGKKVGNLFGTYAEWFGAGIIFILAVKSLIQAIF